MADKEGFYDSSNGKDKVAYYIWLPESGDVKGFVQLVHGMIEHSGRYEHFARFLNKNGYGAVMNDHIGHGKTAPAGALGLIAADGGGVMAEDVHKLTEIIKSEYGNPKIFLLGHSMGSFVARLYCTRYGAELSGALFSGTSGGGYLIHTMWLLTRLTALFKGDEAPGHFIAGLTQKQYNRAHPGTTGREWLSRDPEVWKGDDPLCRFTFSLGAYKALFKLILDVNDPSWFRAYPKDLPTFLFSGLEDPVGDFGKGVLKTYKDLVDAGNANVYIKLYEDGRHEMLNELNKDEVYTEALDFIEECFSKA
ncbi:MAG: lysophospholipase [Clostridiales bacterium]|jgi:alpha-beta hydrolase superfamily lysophospholipase|nr:lysophospholipase [Clostridiales bacterium]